MFRSLAPWKERLPIRRSMSRMEEEMESMIDRVFGENGSGWTPRADLAETDTGYEISVDLPGLKPEDVNVEVREGSLWITGEKQEEKEEQGKTFHRIERHYGQFRRLIPLPETVDPEKVKAQFQSGVLKVTVPKSEGSRPKRIEVQTTT